MPSAVMGSSDAAATTTCRSADGSAANREKRLRRLHEAFGDELLNEGKDILLYLLKLGVEFLMNGFGNTRQVTFGKERPDARADGIESKIQARIETEDDRFLTQHSKNHIVANG